MSKLRVFLADDHKIVREGLTLLINNEPDMEVVGEAERVQTAVALVERLRPDVVVMDISMPGMSGLKATERLAKLSPTTFILTLTRHRDDGYVLSLLAAGTKGYVLKQSSSAELLRAIRAVAAGQTYLDPAVTGQALVTVAWRDTKTAHEAPLSRREEEVLRLIARGLLNKEVAARLNISIKTAEAHKANAMAKLGMTSRVDIVNYAVLNGWLEHA
jgi:DNA-binding NarL/FixJ family response regulator